jgi:lipoprotein-releasing system permease protein
MIIPLSLAREIIGTGKNISAIEVKVTDNADIDEVRESILDVTGSGFNVKTRLMQHDLLYRILKSEKWAVFFILTFILIIAIFNIIGSMTMLIIEKKKDISLLKALGATRSMVRKIFLIEGTLIVMAGALLGVILGFVVCYLQQKFEFVRLDNAESFIIEAYPVAMNPLDFISVIGTVFLIGLSASFYTSKVLVDKDKVKLA